MSVAAWLGIAGGVVALLGVIQTLRLRAVKRELAQAKLAVEDANARADAADARRTAEGDIARKWELRYRQLDDRLRAELAVLGAVEDAADADLARIDHAHGDDDAVLAALRAALQRAGEPLPEG